MNATNQDQTGNGEGNVVADIHNPPSPPEEKRVQWIKKGGGTFYLSIRKGDGEMRDKPIKENQKFWAFPSEIPQGFRDILIPVEELPSDVTYPSQSQFRKEQVTDVGDLDDEQRQALKDLDDPDGDAADGQDPVTDTPETVPEGAEGEAATPDTPDQEGDETPTIITGGQAETIITGGQADGDATATADTGEGDDTGEGGDEEEAIYVLDRRGGGYYYVVNAFTSKRMHDKALREGPANELLESLNS